MINPDIENLILIPNDDIVQLDIEKMTKVRNENKILKTAIVLIVVITTIVIANYKSEIDHERIKKHR